MILPYKGINPSIAPSVYIAPNAYVIGTVAIGPKSSIWFNTLIRGDVNEVKIGTGTNIQDGSLLHVADEHSLIIGDYVTVGHGVNLHACTIGNGVLIGMGAIILNGANIGDGSIIGAGSLVPEGESIPSKTLALGVPAKVIRRLSDEEVGKNKYWAEKYIRIAEEYKNVKL